MGALTTMWFLPHECIFWTALLRFDYASMKTNLDFSSCCEIGNSVDSVEALLSLPPNSF